MNRSGLFLIFSALVFAPRLSAQNQAGPNYVVTTLTDRDNLTAKVGDCSLREAIRAATAKNVPAMILFKEGLRGTLSLNASFGQLTLTKPVKILGPGARLLTISAGGSQRVFRTSGGPHLISGMTLQGGRISSGTEGGGGIWNSGTLTIEDCTVSGNQVTSFSGFTAKGGGIYTTGTMFLIRSTVSGNSATGGTGLNGAAGSDGYGGGIFNEGDLSAFQCTFQGNTGTGGDGGDRKGFACGAIYNDPDGSVALDSCTVSGNVATGGTREIKPSPAIGGIFSVGTCSVTSSVIAGNTATGFAAHPDVRGSFSSGGYNLIGATTGFPVNDYPVNAFNKTTDQRGTEASRKDAKLDSLKDNGGPVNTMLPLTGSPLIDKGKTSSDILDQRGYLRLVDEAAITNASGGNGTDIGAVESGAPVPKVVMFFNGSALVTLNGDAGAAYQFEYSNDLQPPWTEFEGEVKVADGSGRLFFVDPGPLPDRRFYRAVKEAP